MERKTTAGRCVTCVGSFIDGASIAVRFARAAISNIFTHTCISRCSAHASIVRFCIHACIRYFACGACISIACGWCTNRYTGPIFTSDGCSAIAIIGHRAVSTINTVFTIFTIITRITRFTWRARGTSCTTKTIAAILNHRTGTIFTTNGFSAISVV